MSAGTSANGSPGSVPDLGKKPKEVFRGPRLAVAVRAGTRARSAGVLLLVSVFFGVALATALAAATWYVVQLVSHALGSGS